MNDAPLLEERLAAAFSDDIKAADLAALIAETEAAVVVAAENAERERKTALDIASPDAKAARAAAEDARFRLDRLRTVLPRLQQRHEEAQQTEYLEQWFDDYIAIEAERDALAAELRELYPEWARKLIDLLTRIAANDGEISKLLQARPAGAPNLRGAELEARNLDAFNRSVPSIATELKLPAWGGTDAVKWPPPRLPLGVIVAQSMGFSPHPGADWAQANEEHAVDQRAEQKRVASYREQQANAQKKLEKGACS
jgi:hypothetical protein